MDKLTRRVQRMKLREYHVDFVISWLSEEQDLQSIHSRLANDPYCQRMGIKLTVVDTYNLLRAISEEVFDCYLGEVAPHIIEEFRGIDPDKEKKVQAIKTRRGWIEQMKNVYDDLVEIEKETRAKAELD